MGFLRRLIGGSETDDELSVARWSASGEGPFDVAPIPGEWQFQVTFDDVVANAEEDRVASFVERLTVEREVRQAVHDDRDTVLIRAAGVSAAEMQVIAERVWADTEHEAAESEPFEDD
jgi:hypothetical protein